MSTDPTRRRMRRRLAATNILMLLTLAAPVAFVGAAGDDMADSMKYSELDSVEFSDAVDARYTNRVDVLSVADEDGYGRHTVIYVDLERRDDCEVIDKHSAEPGISCTDAPKPTEVAR